MEEHSRADTVHFGGFRFDRGRRLLAHHNEDGSFVPVAIGSRALDILGLLIDRHGNLVSRDEILNAVWPGVVEGANVTVQISALRRALDKGRSGPSLIQTVPGRGYRFAASVTQCAAEPLPGGGGNGEDRGDDIRPVSPVRTGAQTRPGHWHGIAAMLVILAVAGSMAGWVWDHWRFGGADTRPRLSLAVRPFTNLGIDPDREHLVDAITADLTTGLFRIPDIFVISRNSALTSQNQPVDAKQIGRELGVRYVLEGSIQRSGRQVRVNIQLIDAKSDSHVWVERFDGDTSNLFALQDDITRRIAIALHLELTNGRPAGKPSTPARWTTSCEDARPE